MIFLSINKDSKGQFIYQQIYEGIKDYILKGKLKPGDKLPTKRALANQLKVSVNSVMNAYEQLLAEGYIYTVERKGYFVEEISQFISDGNETNFPSDLKEKEVSKEGWLSLSHMTADITLFPIKKWFKFQQHAFLQHQRELSEIIHPQGPYIVRKEIARLLALSRGVRCEPEQVIIGDGTISLVRQLMEMQDRNSKIAVENPGYARLYYLLKKMGFNVDPIPLDEKGIRIDEVEEKKANFVIVTPSHQFPTGKIMPISRRIELLNWAAIGENRYIIEDDYDSEYKYKTDHIPALQSLDRNQRVIYMGTFSKTILPGLRISYMVLPPELLRAYRNHFHYHIQTSNTLNLFTLYYFIESGEYQRHLKRMNNHYEEKRKILIDELRETFEDRMEIEDVPAGLHFLTRFQTGKTYEQIEHDAKKEKLEIYTMKRFSLTEMNDDQNIELIIGFANIPKTKIKEAVQRLKRVIF